MGIEINIPNSTREAAEFGYLDFSKFSQSFIGGFDLQSIGCHFSVGAGNPGIITINVYLGDYPSGSSLGSATSDGDTVTAVYTSSNYRTFTFSPVITLAAGTTYCFSVEIANENFNTHYLILHRTSTSTYADGNSYRYKDTIPEWQSQSTYDIISVIRSPDAPGKPTTPSPSNAASNITLDETPLSWVDGGNTDTYEIYWRIQGDDWDLVGIAQAGVSWAVSFGTLAYGTTYEWRIDATNVYGITTGDTWSFDTISFDQLRISYRLIGGGNGRGPYDDPPGVQGTDWEWTGENNMLTVRKLVVAANNKIWHEDI